MAAPVSKVKLVGSGLAFCIMFIAGWEGKSLTAYRDVIGVPTICYGHTEGVQIGDVATPEECRAQLTADAQATWDEVDRLVQPPMKPWEQAAFTSFAYNVGIPAFARSGVLADANAGDMPAACLELLKWIYAGRPKQIVQGLVNRRQAEFQLCIGATAE